MYCEPCFTLQFAEMTCLFSLVVGFLVTVIYTYDPLQFSLYQLLSQQSIHKIQPCGHYTKQQFTKEVATTFTALYINLMAKSQTKTRDLDLFTMAVAQYASVLKPQVQVDKGGHDCQFIDHPPTTLCCSLCTLPFRDPHLLKCCGKKSCQLCIQQFHLDGKPCPFCKQTIASTMLDKELRDKVLDLAVLCTNKPSGCKWKGELRNLQTHLTEECLVVEEECQYGCGKRLPRSRLNSHERDDCPQRPLEVQFASFQRYIASQFAVYDYKLAQMEAQLFCPPCKLTMSSYFKHKASRDEWFSPPFYSRPGGYKLCLKVNTNGDRDGTGSHVSVYVYLMRGENDDRLVWPFQATLKIQLVNHKKHNRSKIVEFDQKAAIRGIADRITDDDTKDLGWGFSRFVSHRRVEEVTDHTQYLLDGSLMFIVADIIMCSTFC